MSMENEHLHLVAIITPKPEYYATCLNALKQILEPTLAEKGCYRFELYENHPSTALILVETFHNKAALDFHYAQAYTKQVFSLYEGKLEKEPDIHYLSLRQAEAQKNTKLSRYEVGLNNLLKIDGENGQAVVDELSTVSPGLAQYIVEYPFGDVYQRGGLGIRDRELATIAMLSVIGDTRLQLSVHIKAGLNVGLTVDEIEEVILQSSVYAGFPRAINAMKVLAGIKAEID